MYIVHNHFSNGEIQFALNIEPVLCPCCVDEISDEELEALCPNLVIVSLGHGPDYDDENEMHSLIESCANDR